MSDARTGARPLVLVVSSDAVLLQRWCSALEALGIAVEDAGGAVQALCRLAEPGRPACRLLLIDPGLAGMGATALAAAASGLPGAPRIAGLGAALPPAHPALAWPPAGEAVARFAGETRAIAGPATPPAAAPVTGCTVLLVEDNEVNRTIASRMLGMLGYRCIQAVDGAAGVEVFRKGGIGAVLMDVQMPVMDGYEATRAIRAHEPPGSHVPIIGLSAHALPEDRDQALAAGMDDYLTKPVVMEALGACLRRWIFGSSCEIPLVQPPEPGAVLDQEVLARLRGFGPEVLRELLGHLVSDLPAKRAAIAAQLAAGDLGGVRRTAHALKGSSGSVGATRLMHAAAQLMDDCKREDVAAARASAHALDAEAEATLVAIAAALG